MMGVPSEIHRVVVWRCHHLLGGLAQVFYFMMMLLVEAVVMVVKGRRSVSVQDGAW